MKVQFEINCERCYNIETDNCPQRLTEDYHPDEARIYLLCPRCGNNTVSVGVEVESE